MCTFMCVCPCIIFIAIRVFEFAIRIIDLYNRLYVDTYIHMYIRTFMRMPLADYTFRIFAFAKNVLYKNTMYTKGELKSKKLVSAFICYS